MIALQAGFDCVYVDMEHSPISLETTSIICAGCQGLGITPLVRPPSHAADWISRALDGGAQGLIVPHVSNAGEAQAIVSAARFPPLGRRSVMGPTPALAYKAMALGETDKTLNSQTALIVMIATLEGVERSVGIARALSGARPEAALQAVLRAARGVPGVGREERLRALRLRAAHRFLARQRLNARRDARDPPSLPRHGRRG